MQHDPYATQTPEQTLPKRSKVRTFFGWLLIVVAALAVLGTLANLGSGNAQGAGNTGELVGMLLGALLFIGVPLVVGLLLLRRPKA